MNFMKTVQKLKEVLKEEIISGNDNNIMKSKDLYIMVIPCYGNDNNNDK